LAPAPIPMRLKPELRSQNQEAQSAWHRLSVAAPSPTIARRECREQSHGCSSGPPSKLAKTSSGRGASKSSGNAEARSFVATKRELPGVARDGRARDDDQVDRPLRNVGRQPNQMIGGDMNAHPNRLGNSGRRLRRHPFMLAPVPDRVKQPGAAIASQSSATGPT